jgi:hypothetical protein
VSLRADRKRRVRRHRATKIRRRGRPLRAEPIPTSLLAAVVATLLLRSHR